MRAECIEELIRGRRDIEFIYNNHRYSITYYNDNREKYISVCEYGYDPVDVKSAYELLKLHIGKKTLEQIFSSLPDSCFCIC